jgi:outer membrane protein OmpA-like peptidoglycan-associated protein
LGYLTSSRNGNGKDDIFRIVKNYCPQLDITVQGNVRDEQSKQAIPFATVILYSYDNDNLVPVDTFKTQQDGRYSFSLQKGYKYKLVGTAPEYLTNEVIVDTRLVVGRGKQIIEQDVDILLTPIEIDVMVLIQNIYYDFDKADLRAESKTALDKLVRMLNDNPSITIQVASHTDTNGSEKYNIRLSNRRSKSVVDYLEKAGIDKRRLSSFGFGESRPAVYPELTDADEQSNRRTEFRIRTMDFNPTAKKK